MTIIHHRPAASNPDVPPLTHTGWCRVHDYSGGASDTECVAEPFTLIPDSMPVSDARAVTVRATGHQARPRWRGPWQPEGPVVYLSVDEGGIDLAPDEADALADALRSHAALVRADQAGGV